MPATQLLCLYFFLFWNLFLQAAAGKAIHVPFTDEGGQIRLQAVVSGLAGELILDTGAGGLVLNRAHFSSLSSRQTKAGGLFGEVQAGRKWVGEVQIGALGLHAGEATVIDLNHLRHDGEIKLLGLLGYAVLKEYAITLDYRNHLAVFTPRGTLPYVLPAHTDSFAFQLENFLPVVEVNFEGNTLRMGLDSGAEYNLLDRQYAKTISPHFRDQKRVRVHSADGRAVSVRGGKLSRIVLGDKYRCAGMGTLLVDLSPLEKVYKTDLDGILGREFLAPWVFTIDYPRQMLYIHRVIPAPSPAPVADPDIPLVSSRTPF